MARYLGIDASTQSLTGLIVDSDRREIVAEVSIQYDDYFADSYGVKNGVVDQGNGVVNCNPLMWVEALDLLLNTLRSEGHDLSSLAAVSGSGQQHATVYLNEDALPALAGLTPDKPLSSQLAGIFSHQSSPVWMDSSTTQQCREIETAIGGTEALLKLTGNPAFERFSGPQIRKFFQQDPKAYERTTHIALVSSFIASLLAGSVVPLDPGDASGTNLMDIHRRAWSERALAATAPGLDERLAPIVPSGKPVGVVHPYFISRYGFADGCIVAPFSGDNPCSLIGMGMVEPGQVALSLGTSDTLFACLNEPRPSSTGEGCIFASPDDLHYLALTCFMNGSLAREAIRSQYGLNWASFEDYLAQTNPGNEGKIMLPYFEPEIVPKAPAGIIRRGLGDTEIAANVRAVVEAQAMSSRLHSKWMGVDISSLYITGGASANDEIAQVFANVHGCPVIHGETTNAAAFGAALKAYKAHRQDLGWSSIVESFLPGNPRRIDPDPATRTVYDDLINKFSELETRSNIG